ncbi:fatty acid desaturase [Evansella halocellulosilytica]|uniref:fatty acid desaturase n=1 Tax=Evansella halocellulosilytica TaxID=2011013 RepID=UPI000BB7AAB3|nr:fatty acid desaturase [Evansella halocellulosilytica]
MSNSVVSKLKKEIAPYEKPDIKKSVGQIMNSIIPFFLLWFLAYQSLTISYLLTFALSLLAAGFTVRIFILFHDCCHESYFKRRWINELFGTITGILTFHPYYKWKHSHSIHHATSGNLDKRGTGDIWMLTVDEYLAASFWKRLSYRIYRNPFVMFVIGPFYIMLFQNRMNRKAAKRKERLNTYITNIALFAIVGGLLWLIGWQAFLMVHLPIFYISATVGIWLFYVQHQFEDSFFENDTDWSFVQAAIDGSSYYKLPKVLQWLTGNIGFHHIHHLKPRIPNYNLEKVHNNTPILHNVTTITILSSLKSIRFRLWDVESKKFISFQDAKRLRKT